MVRRVTIGKELGRGGGEHDLALSELVSRHLLILGSTGSGKSYFVLGLVAEILRASGADVCSIDAKGEANQLLSRSFLPAFEQGVSGFAPIDVANVSLWGPYGVPLNVLDPDIAPDLGSDVLAQAATLAVERFLGESFGPRGRPLAIAVFRAVIELRGTLETAVNILEDAEFATQCAAMSELSDVAKHTLLRVLPREPIASVRAVSARLRGLLGIDRVRAALCAPRSIRAADLIERRITTIDAATAPLGEERLATAFGSWLSFLVTNAAMSRTSERPLVLLVDEFQRLVDANSIEAFTRLLEQARSKRVSVWFVTQSLASVPTALRESLHTNIAHIFAMRPRDELHEFSRYLPRPKGNVIDPKRPDRLLTKAEESELLTDRLRALPDRHGVHVDVARGQMTPFRARTLPIDELNRRAALLAPRERERILRGRFGVPVDELLRAAGDPVARRLVPAPERDAPVTPDPDDLSSEPTRGRVRRTRTKRPTLEIP